MKDLMRDPERWLWAMVVVAVVLMASTDPWFSWVWFFVITGGLVTTFFIGYVIGKESAWSRGYSKGYRVCMNERRKR